MIDIHSHLYLEWYLDELRKRTEAPCVSEMDGSERLIVIPGTAGVPLTPVYWSIEEKVRYMDAVGIEASLLSPGNPWLGFLEDAKALEWAERTNLGFASLTESSPDRLYALGVLPMSSIGDCLRALGVIREHPALKGVISGTEVCGLPFDEPELDPLWETLDDLECMVLVHPGAVTMRSPKDGLGLTVGVSFPLETTVAAARLLLAEVPERFPNIRFVLAHGGGALPFLLGRLDHVWNAPSAPSEMARRFYIDSLVYEKRTRTFASQRLGEDRLMWGSDHPFSMPDPSDVRGTSMGIDSETARRVLRL